MTPRSADAGLPLFLVTETYPYGFGETFLGDELPYLEKTFHPVILLPRIAAGAPRPLSPRVQVDLTIARSVKGVLARHLAGVLEAFTTSTAAREIRDGFRGPLLHPRGVIRLSSALGRTRVIRGRLDEVLRRHASPGPVIVYTYWLGPQSVAAGDLKRRWPGLTVISRGHGGDIYECRRAPRYLPLTGLALQSVDAAFLVSEHGRAYLARRYPEQAGKLRVARLGVRPQSTTVPASIDGVLRIFSCSNLVAVKRVPLLAAGIREWAQRHADRRVEWTHFGDGPERSRVSREIDVMPSNAVARLGGEVAHDEVLRAYQRQPVDLFVNASESEGVPVSIMEAMGFGIPVLATGVGGTPELVGDWAVSLLPANPEPADIAMGINAVRDRDHTDPAWRSILKAKVEVAFNTGRNYPQFCRDLVELARR